MTSSRSLDRFRSTPGRTPPEALDTGSSTRFRRCALVGFATISTRASSISEVKVRPSSAARFLARIRRSSFILMVVLTHQSISLRHQYVKHGNDGTNIMLQAADHLLKSRASMRPNKRKTCFEKYGSTEQERGRKKRINYRKSN